MATQSCKSPKIDQTCKMRCILRACRNLNGCFALRQSGGSAVLFIGVLKGQRYEIVGYATTSFFPTLCPMDEVRS